MMVSVVIPIFNSAQYIEQCAESLFCQTQKDIEYIFVDDGSTDDSPEVLGQIIERFPERKKQLTIIRHKENKGLAFSRNEGIHLSRGNYVISCDSDDWVHPRMYETMLEAAVSGDYDIVSCGFIRTDGKKEAIYNVPFPKTKDELLSQLLSEKQHASLCNKLIRRSLFVECISPAGAMLEDLVFFTQVVIKAELWYSLTNNFYYWENPVSITNKVSLEASLKKFDECCRNVDLILKVLDDASVSHVFRSEIIRLKNFAKLRLWPHLDIPKCYHLWRNTYPEVNWAILKNKDMAFKFKVFHILALLGVYPLFRKLYKKLR